MSPPSHPFFGTPHGNRGHRCDRANRRHSFDRDEPIYEEEEDVFEDELDPEVPEDRDDDFNRRGADDEANIVISGDPSANANTQKGQSGNRTIKDKKIPNEERTTTPYMTKYERARILGTRALQIRQENGC